MTDDTRVEIRQVLSDHGRLPVDIDAVGDGDDLFQAGMSSHASVNLMLALEDTFDVEFPDEMLTRRVFSSVSEIAAAVMQLQARVA